MPISGPLSQQWSCDSFAIGRTGQVRILDDQDRPSVGKVDKRVSPEQASSTNASACLSRFT